MKKIFSYVILFFVVCFSFSLEVSATTITVSTSGGGIIKTDSEKIPYCTKGECSYEKGKEEVKGKVDGIESEGTAVEYIQRVVTYVLGFLFAVTVIFIIWAGVMILTAAGNEEKVESAKKIIKNCIIGLIVIFLAYPISNFIIGIFDQAKTNKTTTSGRP